jgi:nucleotide-binding universal stress UspA family protein
MHPCVICAVDGSDESAGALAVARTLSSLLAGRLALVCVADMPDEADADVARDARTIALRRAVGESGEEPSPPIRLERGDPAERIAAVAVDEGADLVVVGSRGRGPLTAAVLGSVSAELARTGPRPIVIVPPPVPMPWPAAPPPGSTPSVVCGIDGSRVAHEGARVAARLAARLGLRLVLAHAFRPEASSRAHQGILENFPMLFDEERAAAQRILDESGAALGAETRAVLGETAQELRRLAVAEGAQLLVLGSRGLDAPESLLLGSTSAQVAATASVPVVVVPPTARADILYDGPRGVDPRRAG